MPILYKIHNGTNGRKNIARNFPNREVKRNAGDVSIIISTSSIAGNGNFINNPPTGREIPTAT